MDLSKLVLWGGGKYLKPYCLSFLPTNTINPMRSDNPRNI